jgi:uncharacterized membrane protein
MESEWSFALAAGWGRLATVVIFLAAAALTAWTIALYKNEPPARAVGLGALRAFSIAAVCLFALRLVVRIETVRHAPGTVVVLADASASMRAPVSAGDPTSRVKRLESLLSPEALRSLGREHAVRLWTFSGAPHEIAPAALPSLAPDGADTRIAEAVLDAAGKVGAGLSGVVVVTDGADRGALGTGGTTASLRRRLARLRAPVHVLRVADDAALPDVGLGSVRAAPFAFARAQTEIAVEVVARGLGVSEVPVALTEDGRVVAEAHARLGDRKSAKVTLRFRPDHVGTHVYRVSVPSFDGDRIRENDARDVLVRVTRDETRILIIAGHPTWDVRFLRRLLRRDESVDLVSFFILRSTTDMPLSTTDDLSLIPFPADELFTEALSGFDVVVFQDFDPAPYGVAQHLGRLAEYVKDGGAFVLVGGDVPIARYAATPMAEVLPVTALEAPGAAAGDPSEYRVRLTPEGLRHPVARIATGLEENAAAWNALVPLEGVDVVRGLAPGALALAAHPSLRAGDGPAPVLAVAEPGRGRTVAVLTDSTWLWAFEGAGEGGSAEAYEKLWQNVLRWVLHDPELDRLRVTTDRDRIPRGASIGVDALVLDRDFRPLPSHPITVEIRPAAGGAPVVRREGTTDEEGAFHLEARMEKAGVYHAAATANLPERPGERGARETADHPFLVEGAGDEMGDVAPRTAALRSLARATGGRVVDATAGSLPDLPFAEARDRRVERRREIEVWRHPLSLAVVVGLLALEWGLRRRLGHR